jgi:hypothetical protein
MKNSGTQLSSGLMDYGRVVWLCEIVVYGVIRDYNEADCQV